jgi:hypothetical protein
MTKCSSSSEFLLFQSSSILHLEQQRILIRKLTPNAENRFRLGCGSCLLRKTSDLGRGGFFGRIITRVSSRMSSSSSLLSDETDNCLCTWPCSVVDQSAMEDDIDEDKSPEMSKQNIFLPHNGTHSELQFSKHVIFIKFHCCFLRRSSYAEHMFMIPIESSWISHFYSRILGMTHKISF